MPNVLGRKQQQPVALAYTLAAAAVLALRRRTGRDPWALAVPLGLAVGALPVLLWNLGHGWASGDILGRDPTDVIAQAERIGARFHLDTPGWNQESEKPPFLAEVAGAVWEQRPLRIRYQRWNGEVIRTINPLGLVRKGAAWYLVASANGQARTYRVIRIEELDRLDGQFERPADFDLAAFWTESQATFQERLYRDEIIIRLSPRAMEHLEFTVAAPARHRVLETASPPDVGGWVTARAISSSEAIRPSRRRMIRRQRAAMSSSWVTTMMV